MPAEQFFACKKEESKDAIYKTPRNFIYN